MKKRKKNPKAVALGLLTKKKYGIRHYKTIGALGGRPSRYAPCEHPTPKDLERGYRRHRFDKETGKCWGCGLTREEAAA